MNSNEQPIMVRSTETFVHLANTATTDYEIIEQLRNNSTTKFVPYDPVYNKVHVTNKEIYAIQSRP